ncbi:MAG: deoxyribose-phosphate aldolase [Bacilli bacterium]|jgi:deoxyribose-phosphate aldolase|nr:deoxyribose-phosphate aldolase [Bacilli bacterium]MCI2111317.1 deoxyribose-phosphate aldolase [Bacilli bacterium]
MQFNKFFDHTLLKADATIAEITKLCAEAKEYDFMSVCVNPFYVPLCAKLLKGSSVKVCTVVGFPLGAEEPATIAYAASLAVKKGASEVDMVQNISMAKEHDFSFIEAEVRKVKAAVGSGIVLKVILENCYLSEAEIVESAKACKRGGADFVKTSTGFGKGGATAHDVKLMRRAVGPLLGVKAAGGIHTKKDVLDMIAAGANRIGCSHSVEIMNEK